MIFTVMSSSAVDRPHCSPLRGCGRTGMCAIASQGTSPICSHIIVLLFWRTPILLQERLIPSWAETASVYRFCRYQRIVQRARERQRKVATQFSLIHSPFLESIALSATLTIALPTQRQFTSTLDSAPLGRASVRLAGARNSNKQVTY